MELPPANDRATQPIEKRTRSNRMKVRLIETRLLTVKNNLNAFHGNERTYAIQSRYTPPRSRKQNISLCFLISTSAVISKLMLKITSIPLPPDLGESSRRRRRSAFIYLTFIHTHNLLHYHEVGDQASVEVKGVEEQMLIFSSSLTPGRVKGS